MEINSDKLAKLRYNRKQFTDALHTLSKAIHEPMFNEYVRDATIQRFEYTYETAWKTIKALLSFQGVELRHPRELFKEAFSSGWLRNPEHWDAMIEDRNLTAHTYKERTAEMVYEAISKVYYPELEFLHERITEAIRKNAESPG